MPAQITGRPYDIVARPVDPQFVITVDEAGNKIPSATDTTPSPVKAGDPTSVSVTIANGANLSSAGFVHGALVGIITPAAFTAAAVTFQGSVDGVNYYDIYDDSVERVFASGVFPAAAARFLSLDLNDWLPFNYIKVRSGTAAATVGQGASRDIVLVYAR